MSKLHFKTLGVPTYFRLLVSRHLVRNDFCAIFSNEARDSEVLIFYFLDQGSICEVEIIVLVRYGGFFETVLDGLWTIIDRVHMLNFQAVITYLFSHFGPMVLNFINLLVKHIVAFLFFVERILSLGTNIKHGNHLLLDQLALIRVHLRFKARLWLLLVANITVIKIKRNRLELSGRFITCESLCPVFSHQCRPELLIEAFLGNG